MEDFQFFKKRAVGEIVKDLLRFYTMNIKEIANFNFAIIAPMALLFYLLIQRFSDISESGISFADEDYIIIGFLSIILSLIFIFQFACNFEYILLKEEKLEFSLNRIMTRTIRVFYKYLAWSIMFVLLFIPIILTFFIPILNFFIILAFYYFIVAMTPLFFILRRDKLSFFKAIGESLQLVKNKWWRTLGVNFLIQMIFNIVLYAVAFMFLPFIALSENMSSEELIIALIPMITAYGLVVFVLMTVQYYIPAFIYYSYKDGKNNLFDRIEEIGDE